MEVEHFAGWKGAVIRIAAYSVVATFVAWLIHLLEPALSASFSRKYDGFRWVKGKRGLFQFFSVAYQCIFDAGGLFKIAYDKVSRLEQHRMLACC